MSPTLPSQRRSYWLKTLHQWHWMSAALSLAGLIVFAATGFTLNNAAWIESSARVTTKNLTLPAEVLRQIPTPETAKNTKRLPPDVQQWLDDKLDIRINGRKAEVSADEIYLSLSEPGADAWLSIDPSSGELEYERSSRGWIAYFNDLHKGRHSGSVWAWFIDVFAIACLIFALTGLLLLKLHAKNRPSSWPLVALGVVSPVIIMLLFIH